MVPGYFTEPWREGGLSVAVSCRSPDVGLGGFTEAGGLPYLRSPLVGAEGCLPIPAPHPGHPWQDPSAGHWMGYVKYQGTREEFGNWTFSSLFSPLSPVFISPASQAQGILAYHYQTDTHTHTRAHTDTRVRAPEDLIQHRCPKCSTLSVEVHVHAFPCSHHVPTPASSRPAGAPREKESGAAAAQPGAGLSPPSLQDAPPRHPGEGRRSPRGWGRGGRAPPQSCDVRAREAWGLCVRRRRYRPALESLRQHRQSLLFA